jgi:hypothetical protein
MDHELLRRCVVIGLIGTATAVSAQRGAGGAAPQTPPSPRAAAPIDLTGYWVSIVNEDWRWRMVTPPKGDYASIQNLMTPEARKLADAWDPATDGSCLAYGAAGLMRIPTRLNVTWENDTTLKIETDAGQQTRRVLFDKAAPTPGARSLQGLSIAEWERPGGAGRGGGGGGGGGRAGGRGDAAGPPAAAAGGTAPAGGGAAAPAGGGGRGRGGDANAQPSVGNLKVVTSSLSGGWLRKNGVPYSEAATVTEYFDRFSVGRDEWMVVTTVVSDPKFLTQEFVTSTHFRREADGAKKWDPTPCKPAT